MLKWWIVGGLRPSPPLRALVSLFLTVMLIFSAERIFLWVTLSEHFAEAPSGDILRAFGVGLRFDLAIACLLCLLYLPLLLLSPWRWRRTSALLAGSWVALVAVTLLATLCDGLFFRQFATHLDQSVWQYLPHQATWSLLFRDTPLPWILAVIALASVPGYRACRKRFQQWPESRHLLLSRLALLLCVPFLALGVRGSTRSLRMTSAVAYAGTSLSAAQLTLNGAYTLIQSGVENINDASLHDLVPLGQSDQEALTQIGEQLAAQASGATPAAPNALWHRTSGATPARRTNVVLVILESLDGRYPRCMGGEGLITPELDALAADGLLMDQCYAVGSRTAYGLTGVLTSFPDLAARSAFARTTSEGRMTTIASVLKDRGYRTLFLHGGQPSFDNARGFSASNGFDVTVFEDDFSARSFSSGYGWCDEDLYTETLARLDALAGQPFLAALMTLSFHRPYAIPGGRAEPVFSPDGHLDAHLSAGRYADRALGRFIAQARTHPWFDDTVFVIVADHTDDQRGLVISPAAYRVPFLIYAGPSLRSADPRLRAGRRLSTVCSQIDVAPTILDLLGGSYDSPFFGSSVLQRSPEDGWAVMLRSGKAMAFLDADRRCAVLPFLGGLPTLLTLTGPLLAEPGHDDLLRDRLLDRGLRILQAAEAMYRSDQQITTRTATLTATEG